MTLSPANNPANARGVGSYLLTPRWFLALPIVTSLSGLETVYSVQDGVDCQVPLSLIPQQDAITSVALTAPAIFNVTGSPITPGSSGIISLTLASEAQNSAFLGPSSGGAGVPSFRPIVNADLPTIGISNGGTGQTTQPAALTALLGSSVIPAANLPGLSVSFKDVLALSANTTLTAANTAEAISWGGPSGGVITLPSASTIPAGRLMLFYNYGSGTLVVAVNGGSDFIYTGAILSSVTLQHGDNLLLMGRAGGQVDVVGGSAALQFVPTTFAAAFVTYFNSLPTTLPGTAGVLWNNGGTLSQS